MGKFKQADITEVSRCLLCMDAPCEKSCPKGVEVGKLLRKMYFNNFCGACALQGEETSCLNCSAPCEKSCVLNKTTNPVRIRDSFIGLGNERSQHLTQEPLNIDLTTDICGIKLEHPFLLSSSVVGSTYDMCARAFEAGWAGAAFKTICRFPQHEASPRFSAVCGRGRAFTGFKNIEQLSDHSVEDNMAIFRRLKANYPNKVIIASIMGRNEQEWTELAGSSEAAGADVIECNFSCPNMENSALGVTIGQSPELVERFTRAAKQGTKLPVLAKLTPNITDMVPIAIAAKRGGADGIAAINTINSVTGIGIDSLKAEPNVNGSSMIGGYSGRAVKPIALRFISELANCEELQGLHISGMGGIETWRDGMEFLALGAGSLQTTTAVMEYGYRIVEDLIEGLRFYLAAKNIASVKQFLGIAAASIVPHNQVERDTILFPVIDREKCLGCGRCYISCCDGGHQAITFDATERVPRINGAKCVGCHLCRLVCPSEAIGAAARRITRKP